MASEGRSLAGRSAEAAEELKNLIDASVERVAQGTALLDQTGTTETGIASSIRRAKDITGRIAATSSGCGCFFRAGVGLILRVRQAAATEPSRRLLPTASRFRAGASPTAACRLAIRRLRAFRPHTNTETGRTARSVPLRPVAVLST